MASAVLPIALHLAASSSDDAVASTLPGLGFSFAISMAGQPHGHILDRTAIVSRDHTTRDCRVAGELRGDFLRPSFSSDSNCSESGNRYGNRWPP